MALVGDGGSDVGGDGLGDDGGDGNLLENKLLQFGRGGDEPDITVLFHLVWQFDMSRPTRCLCIAITTREMWPMIWTMTKKILDKGVCYCIQFILIYSVSSWMDFQKCLRSINCHLWPFHIMIDVSATLLPIHQSSSSSSHHRHGAPSSSPSSSSHLPSYPPVTIILLKYMQEISYFETEREEIDQNKYGYIIWYNDTLIDLFFITNRNANLTALPCTGESSSRVPSYITFVRTLKATVLA